MANRNRTVKPEVERLQLTDGDWIEIKKQLNVAEQKQLEAVGMVAKVVDGRLFNIIDWAIHDIDRAVIFVLDWSFRDADDKPIKFSADALRAIYPEDFDEINNAILGYIIKQAEAKKSLRTAQTPKLPATESNPT